MEGEDRRLEEERARIEAEYREVLKNSVVLVDRTVDDLRDGKPYKEIFERVSFCEAEA